MVYIYRSPSLPARAMEAEAVLRDSGTVLYIHLRFPRDVTTSDVVQFYTQLLGPPTTAANLPQPRQCVTWADDRTLLSVCGLTQGNGDPSITVTYESAPTRNAP